MISDVRSGSFLTVSILVYWFLPCLNTTPALSYKGFRSHLVNSSKLCTWPFWSIGQSPLLLSGFAGWSPLLRLFLGLWCVPVDPWSIDVHERQGNSFGLRLNSVTHCCLTVAIVVRSKQIQHPSRRQLWHAQYFIQVVTRAVFGDYLPHLQSAVCQYKVVNLSRLILRGSHFRSVWMWLNKTNLLKKKSHRLHHPKAIRFHCAISFWK